MAAVAATLLAAAGGSLTDLGPWYQNLVQPAFKPPDWAFPVIWTIVFACAATSGAWAWLRLPDRGERWMLAGLFALNGLLNMGWSLLFFTLKQPVWSLVEVVALWGSILALILFLRRRAPASAWLLAPYLAWVTVAAALNLEIVRLNP